MGESSNWSKSGLIFLRDQELDIVEIANQIACVTETLGHRVKGVHIQSDTCATVCTERHEITMLCQEDVTIPSLSEPATLFLALRLVWPKAAGGRRFARDSMMARCLQTLQTHLHADYVKWAGSDIPLPGAGFLAALGEKPPVATTASTDNAMRLPPVEETNAVLQSRFASQDPVIFDGQTKSERLKEIFSDGWQDPEERAAWEAEQAYKREIEDIERTPLLRLSAWIFSFAVTLFALPIGIALLVLNLVKGENLRLASQSAALTGTFLAFQTMGTTAQAMTTLQSILN